MMKDADLYAVFAAYCRTQSFFSGGGVLCALSGGVDSVVLLHFLKRLSDEQNFPLHALHVNHMLRGANAERDESFCRSLCASLAVPFTAVQVPVGEYAARHRVGEEEAGRTLRYAAFLSFCRSHPAFDCVCVAHHQDDLAETVLFRLARGCGTRGMTPLLPSRCLANGVRLVRPLLQVSKKALLAYAQQHALTYVYDETNDQTNYARNLIRAQVMPALVQVNRGAVEHIAAYSALAAEDEAYFSGFVQSFLKRYPGPGYPCSALLRLHDAVNSRILGTLYQKVCGEYPSLVHTQQMRSLCACAQSFRYLTLPHGVRFYTDGTTFSFLESAVRIPAGVYRFVLHEGVNDFTSHGFIITVQQTGESDTKFVEKNEVHAKINKISIRTVINSAKLNGAVYIHSRKGYTNKQCYQSGGCRHAVKELLSQNKVPQMLRQALPLFCDDSGIFWVPYCSMRDDVNPALDSQSTRMTIIFEWKGFDYDTKRD